MKARPILCFVLILIISLSSESCHNGKTKGITGKWIRQDYDSLNKILESNKTHRGKSHISHAKGMGKNPLFSKL